MPKYHLAVDIGASSGRAFVGWLENDCLRSRELHRFQAQDMFFLDRRVRNIFRYYEEIVASLGRFRNEYGCDLASIGVDSYSCDFTILNRWGQPVFLTRSYRDPRLKHMGGAIEREYGGYRLYRRNGNHAIPSDTLQQLLRMRDERDPALDDPHGIMFMADTYHYLLGAGRYAEHSNASYSRIFNRHDNDWDDEVFDAFGLPKGLKTEVVYAGDVIGKIRPDIAADAGIRHGVDIITPCGHDTSCAALSIPDLGDDWAFISSGSWSLIGTETRAPILTEEAWRHNFCNSTMPLRVNMFQKGITGMWFMQQCRKAWGRHSDADIVARAEDEPDLDCFIDVNSMKFYAPPDMPRAVAGTVAADYGMVVDPDDYGQIARICLVSLAMKYRYYLELIREMTGKEIHKIYIVGGGAKNRLLNQLTASICGVPVCTAVTEGSATGNLLLQMYGSGEFSSRQDMRSALRRSFPATVYEPKSVRYWEEKYRLYRDRVHDHAEL